MPAIFGPAGNSDSYTQTVSKSSVNAPEWIRKNGLEAYEYQCGNGVRISEETAKRIGKEAEKHKIVMSLHSPYYISLANLSNSDKNIGYILSSCRAARWLGATRIVVHSGAVAGRERVDAIRDAAIMLKLMLDAIEQEGYGEISLCPETMGKINQLGNLDEVLQLCKTDERLIPCIDFGHLYARTLGEMEGYEKMLELFNTMENAIGVERASRFHSHFSHIEYSKGGEKRHLRFNDLLFGPDFRPVARIVAERNYSPVFICESAGTQAEDALEMKRIYNEELFRL